MGRGRQNMPSWQEFNRLEAAQRNYIRLGDTRRTGKGIFANQDIPKFTRIICEVPTIDLRKKYLSTANVKVAFESLPANRKSAVMDLHFDFSDSENATPLSLIFDQNAMDTDRGRVLCTTVARINHSCLPNAMGNMNWLTHCYTVQVLHDIVEGEEITINYIDVELPKEQRDARLKAIWNFECRCLLCDQHFSARFLQMSNMRRAWLQQFRDTISRFDPGPPPVTREQARQQSLNESQHNSDIHQFIQTAEHEGLPGSLAFACWKAAESALRLNNRDLALKWASETQDILMKTIGIDTAEFNQVILWKIHNQLPSKQPIYFPQLESEREAQERMRIFQPRRGTFRDLQ
ncbi:hypothetical protein HYFRA_00009341 [Hymenoscyphus fraxineus]|uniref:SET domain-containing protein n=1 Tax=Hymenoscyphus fraxineus TaxID=746836 RepID=A0A9N9PVD1_9HELO|nr:hypothetical protein HYFRA_00009341 [Hymenoscyphus fraxineus]